MGIVIPLSKRRAQREARVAVAAERGSLHPALRWIAGDAFYIAHRKDGGGVAACGAEGALILAPPGVPLCSACYPPRAAGV